MSFETLYAVLKNTDTLPDEIAEKISKLSFLFRLYGVKNSPYNMPCVKMLLEFFHAQILADADSDVALLEYSASVIKTLHQYQRELMKHYISLQKTPATRRDFKLLNYNIPFFAWADYGLDKTPHETWPLYHFEKELSFSPPRMFRYLTDHLYIERHLMAYRLSLNQDIKNKGHLSKTDQASIASMVFAVISTIQSDEPLPLEPQGSFIVSERTQELYLDFQKSFEIKKAQDNLQHLDPHADGHKMNDFEGPDSAITLWNEAQAPATPNDDKPLLAQDRVEMLTQPIGILEKALRQKIANLSIESESATLLDLAQELMVLRGHLLQDALKNPSLLDEQDPLKNKLYLYSVDVAMKVLEILPFDWKGYNDVEALLATRPVFVPAAHTDISIETKTSAREVMLVCAVIGFMASCVVAVVLLGIHFGPDAHLMQHIIAPLRHIATLLTLEILGGIVVGAGAGLLCYRYQSPSRGQSSQANTKAASTVSPTLDEPPAQLYDKTLRCAQKVAALRS